MPPKMQRKKQPEKQKKQPQKSKKKKRVNHTQMQVAHPSERQYATTGYIEKALRQQGSDLAALTILAKAIAAPRDLPPMRLPEVLRRRTDVRHVWNGGMTSPVVIPAASGGHSPRIGGTTLSMGEGMFFLTKDAIAPVIYSVGLVDGTGVNSGAAGNAIYTLHFAGVDSNPSLGGGWDGALFFTQGTFPVKASPAAPQIVHVNTMCNPIAVKCVTPVSPCTTDQAVFVATNGATYSFFGGGMFEIAVAQTDGSAPLAWTGGTTNVPAGGGIVVNMLLHRYTGTLDDDEFDVPAITVAANTSMTIVRMSSQVDSLPVGYYRFSVVRIQYNAPTADNTYNACVMRVRYVVGKNTNAGNTALNYVFVNPVMPNVFQAPFAYQTVRANASALLLTSVTPNMYRGGAVMGAKFLAGDGWYNISKDEIADRSLGSSRNAYRGDLGKGCYTWTEFEDDMNMVPGLMDSGRMATSTFAGLSTRVNMDATLPILRDKPGGGLHAIYYACPTSTDTTSNQQVAMSAQSFMWRVDQHIEYVTNSQMSTSAMSVLQLSDLTRACQTLASCPLFTENWIHLDQLWGTIKRVGKSMLAAGGSAAARVALQEMATGMAALAL